MPELYSTIRDTADTPASRFLQNIDKVRFNPSAMQQLMIEQIQDALQGKVTLVDATSPFSALLESQALVTAGFVIDNETTTRRQYSAAAQNVADLYLHMSDKDYIDRFVVPATTTFTVLFSEEELLDRMVVESGTGIRKVVIPRFSTITVSDTVFTLLYPVEIKLMQHGALQVVYDMDDPSPLQTLTSNEPSWSNRVNATDRSRWISVEVTAVQVRVSSSNSDVNQATGYNKQLAFSDDFCYARVFYKNNSTSGAWREIRTTHTDQVYDTNIPTAVLQVLDGFLGVRIPQVYLTNNMISGSLRVDIYTSKGEIRINASNFKHTAFEYNWATIDSAERTNYVAAWQGMRNVLVYNNGIISGGAPALTFEELLERVIMNTGSERHKPITPAQIMASLTRAGFDVVKHINVVTGRVLLATRALPKPFDERLVTAGSASIESLVISFQEALTHSKARGHGDRLTLTPEILYENVNGIIKVVSEAEQAAVMALDPERRALAVTQRNFLFTPFHYVLDATGTTFETRPYFLDMPTVQTSMFIDENDSTGMKVGTGKISIMRTENGFRILATTKSNEPWRELDNSQAHAQLSYMPVGESTKCYLNGNLIGRTGDNEMLFEFLLDSGFDIDSNHRLQVNSFKILNLDDRIIPVGLNQEFDLVYSASSVMPSGWTTHGMDSELGRFLLPNRIAAVTQEKISVIFGQHLKNLWSSSRSIPSSAPYRTYDSDVYATYTETTYQRDPVTGAAFKIGAGGQIEYNIIGNAGDVVKDSAGNPVILHRRGDVILTNGVPTPVGQSYLSRQVDLFFIDGVYYFADDYSTITYRNEMVATVVGWIVKDLAEMGQDLLELTEIFFYPKTSMGSVQAMVEGGNITQVQAAQTLTARLFVGDAVFENLELRDALTTSTIKVIDEHFKKSTVSMSAIISQLRGVYGNDVISYSLSGLGGLRNLEAITMLVESERCSIRKKLAALPNGQLIVREDVTVDFVRHSQQS